MGENTLLESPTETMRRRTAQDLREIVRKLAVIPCSGGAARPRAAEADSTAKLRSAHTAKDSRKRSFFSEGTRS